MKTRNLSKLVGTKEFQELILKFPIKFLVKDGSILLYNEHVYIYIYCYMIEGYADFSLFDINRRVYCPDSRYLTLDIMNDTIKQIYKFYEETHIESIINEGIPGEIEIESSFLARIEILKKYFPDLLEGKIEKYEKYFVPLQGGYFDMFHGLKAFVENKSEEQESF